MREIQHQKQNLNRGFGFSAAHLRTAPRSSRVLSFVLSILVSQAAFAQNKAVTTTSDSKPGVNPIHAFAMTFLPSRVPGVTEVTPGWGLGLTLPTAKGTFELDSFLGRGDGATYQSVFADYRLDIPNEVMLVHFLMGFHTDFWAGPDGQSYISGGWQYGGGVLIPLGGPIFLRSDFKYRFSPGASLLILVGLNFVFPSGSGG